MSQEKKLIAAIDPGLSGAIAIIEGDTAKTYDMPTYREKKKNWIDVPLLIEILKQLPKGTDIVIEAVHSMPRQGIASTFKFGRGFGILIGVCACLELNTIFVYPQTWKKYFKLSQNKEDSIALANKIFGKKIPKSKDGRAEALLLAYYYLKTMEEEDENNI